MEHKDELKIVKGNFGINVFVTPNGEKEKQLLDILAKAGPVVRFMVFETNRHSNLTRYYFPSPKTNFAEVASEVAKIATSIPKWFNKKTKITDYLKF